MSFHTNAAINAYVRRTIDAQGNKLITIEATTKKGEVKRFTFSAAGNAANLSPIVTIAGAQAAATRAINNPNLVNVWDVNKFNTMCREAGYKVPSPRKRKGETPEAFKLRRATARAAYRAKVAPLKAKAWRSFNLDNVLSLKAGGNVTEFRTIRPELFAARNP